MEKAITEAQNYVQRGLNPKIKVEMLDDDDQSEYEDAFPDQK